MRHLIPTHAMALHDPEFLRLGAKARARITAVPPSDVEGLQAKGALSKGATALAYDELAEKVQELVPDPATPIVRCCNGGNQGALAADTLQNLGYLNVTSIAGGLTVYLEADRLPGKVKER